MTYTTLDMESYPRKAHFTYFNSLQNPYMGVTQQVDVTALRRYAKANGLPIFLSTLFAVTQAANSEEAFRLRVKDGGIVRYDWCRPSYTVALDDDTYCYCTVNTQTDDLRQFVAEGKREQELAKQAVSLSDGEDDDDLLFISCLPWLSYTAFTQPTPVPADYNPRISWGKLYEQGDRVLMPLTVLAHHGLMDGLHLSRFYEAFDRCIQRVTR